MTWIGPPVDDRIRIAGSTVRQVILAAGFWGAIALPLVGIPLLAAAAFWIGMILSLCLYGAWSFSKYRQVRGRLYDPKPPSPFRHPSRLVTILGTSNDELSDYGKRVRVTGWVLLAALGMMGVVANFIVTT